MAGPQGLIPVIDRLEMKNKGLGVTTRLGLEDSGGMVCVGPVHYNTVEEIKRFGEVLGRVAGSDDRYAPLSV